MNTPLLANSQNPLVISNGLVAYWSLNEGAGSIARDFSGNRNDGTLVNSPSWNTGIKVGNSLLFNGTSPTTQRVSTTYNASLGDFSAVAWFRVDGAGAGNYERIVDMRFNDGFAMCRQSNAANTWGGYVKDTSASNPIMVTLTDGIWHHLVLVRSSSVATAYGDGGAVTISKTVSTASLSSATPLTIGWSNVAHGYNAFKGAIDEVRMYNRALNISEIKALYNAKGT